MAEPPEDPEPLLDTVGCKSFSDFAETVGEIPVNSYKRPYDEYVAIRNERDYSKTPDTVSESLGRMSPIIEDDVPGSVAFEEPPRTLDAGISDVQATIHDQLVGENIVMSEQPFTGTHDEEFNDVPRLDGPPQRPRTTGRIPTALNYHQKNVSKR